MKKNYSGLRPNPLKDTEVRIDCICGQGAPPSHAETGVYHWRSDCPYLCPEERYFNALLLAGLA